MAVEDRVTAHEIARHFAGLVRDEAVVERLWVSTRRDTVELWLLVTPSADLDSHRHLHGLSMALDDEFPRAYFQLYVINPRHYSPLNLEHVLPSGAEEVPLRPS